MTTLDPSCEFYLRLSFDQLFEKVGAAGIDYRCKGCGESVRTNDREKHHRGHKKGAERESGRRQVQANKVRTRNLALARAARGRKTA